jgi:hypothetical protein
MGFALFNSQQQQTQIRRPAQMSRKRMTALPDATVTQPHMGTASSARATKEAICERNRERERERVEKRRGEMGKKQYRWGKNKLRSTRFPRSLLCLPFALSLSPLSLLPTFTIVPNEDRRR